MHPLLPSALTLDPPLLPPPPILRAGDVVAGCELLSSGEPVGGCRLFPARCLWTHIERTILAQPIAPLETQHDAPSLVDWWTLGIDDTLRPLLPTTERPTLFEEHGLRWVGLSLDTTRPRPLRDLMDDTVAAWFRAILERLAPLHCTLVPLDDGWALDGSDGLHIGPAVLCVRWDTTTRTSPALGSFWAPALRSLASVDELPAPLAQWLHEHLDRPLHRACAALASPPPVHVAETPTAESTPERPWVRVEGVRNPLRNAVWSVDLAPLPVLWSSFCDLLGEPLPDGVAPDDPVRDIPWDDAVRYCNALSVQAGLPLAYQTTRPISAPERARGFRLPTAEEWVRAVGTLAPDTATTLLVAHSDRAVSLLLDHGLTVYPGLFEWLDDAYRSAGTYPSSRDPRTRSRLTLQECTRRALQRFARRTVSDYPLNAEISALDLGFRVARTVS
jgi:hypothetical protein